MKAFSFAMVLMLVSGCAHRGEIYTPREPLIHVNGMIGAGER